MAAATTITLSIDSTLIANAVAALNWKSGYQAQVPDPNNPFQLITNPQTPSQNAKQMVINHVLSDIRDYNAMTAQQALPPISTGLIQ